MSPEVGVNRLERNVVDFSPFSAFLVPKNPAGDISWKSRINNTSYNENQPKGTLMRKRMLQIKVVDAIPENEYKIVMNPNRESNTTIVVNAIERGFMRIGIAVVAYVAVDTLRQVLIAKAIKSWVKA